MKRHINKNNLENDVISLLKNEKLYARKIKERLNIKQDKTLSRMLNRLLENGVIERIECYDFENEGINDKDKRHVYFKFVGEKEISYYEKNKKMIWNRIIFNLKKIVNSFSPGMLLKLNDEEKEKMEFLFKEFIPLKNELQNTPTYSNYGDFASMKDLYFLLDLLNLLTRLDNDFGEKYQVGLINFIRSALIKFEKEKKELPAKFQSDLKKYFDEIFKTWINEENKWDLNNSYNYILRTLMLIFSDIEYKGLWENIIEKFFIEENLMKLKANNPEDPYKQLLELFTSFIQQPYVRNELSKHEYQLFTYQSIYLGAKKKDIKTFEFFRELRKAIS